MTTPVTPPAADTQPPTAPGTLSATAINSGRIDLSWGAASDNVAVTGYRIERCQGAGCSSFAQIAAPTGTGTTYSDTSAAANTSYSYRVRAVDAVPNLGPYSNTATATTPSGSAPPTLVAAFAFDEGSGTSAADASGSGNSGTAANTTWAAAGKYGKALNFNGTSSRVTVPDAASLQLTSAMTLEAWVYPTTVTNSWRDVIQKGDDNYYLMATSTNSSRPAGGGIIGGSFAPAYGTAALATNTWSHLAVSYDGAAVRLYLNGTQVSSVAKTGSILTSTSPLTIGSDPFYGQYFSGMIDDVRVYNAPLTSSQIQADMTTPVTPPAADTQPPTAPGTLSATAINSGRIDLSWGAASDNVAVTGYRIERCQGAGCSSFAQIAAPTGTGTTYSDTSAAANTSYSYRVRAVDAVPNLGPYSATATATTPNGGTPPADSFENEVLATGLPLPVGVAFLPDGRMLVAELGGKVEVLSPPYAQADPVPFLDLPNTGPGTEEGQEGLHYIALDPDYPTNHYFYVYYVLGNPNVDRLSRFTANASSTGTIAGSELVLYQDPEVVGGDHHGGAIAFGNDGKLYFATGDHIVSAADSQNLTKPRGKLHRINKDGTIPTDNPFYDGAGPNVDSIWARGLRNPFQMSFDGPSGKLYIGDVGGNDRATAKEELNVGARGANYGWPNCEGPCGPPYTDPVYSYPHNGRDACIVAGFVYHGSQFPSSYAGSYFFADYAQNWIKRLTFDANGKVSGVFNFEPMDGSPDGPTGDYRQPNRGA